MSYSRWGPNSDVYVFGVEHGIECCNCNINGFGSVVVRGPADMLEHLADHIIAGHKVPADAIAELEAEQ